MTDWVLVGQSTTVMAWTKTLYYFCLFTLILCTLQSTYAHFNLIAPCTYKNEMQLNITCDKYATVHQILTTIADRHYKFINQNLICLIQ
jgi:hypothetical protein